MNVQTKDIRRFSDDDFRSLVNAAGEQLDRGDLSQAVETCERLIEGYPEFTPGWYFMGLAKQRLGESQEAVKFFETAIDIRPAYPSYRLSLAEALTSLGRLEEARAQYERVLELEPLSKQALLLLAQLENKRGDKQRVRALLKQAAALHGGPVAALKGKMRLKKLVTQAQAQGVPSAYAEKYANAMQFCELGRHEEAHAEFSAIAKQDPGCIAAVIAAARIDLDSGRFDEAYRALATAFERNPSHAGLIVQLAEAACRRTQYEEAKELLEKLDDTERDDAEYWYVKCILLTESGCAAEAIKAGTRAVELAPSDVRVKGALGRAYIVSGDFRDAGKIADELVKSEPGQPEGYVLASTIDGIEVDSPKFAKMQKLLQDPKLLRMTRAVLSFSIASIYRRSGQTERAFEHYSQGNRLIDVAYSKIFYEREIDRIIANYGQRSFEMLQGIGSEDERPILVVGMPRSGTSLVEQILASHPLCHGAGELTALGRIGREISEIASRANTNVPTFLEKLGSDGLSHYINKYLSELLANAPSDASRVTDKLPHNFHSLGLFALMFPNARVIYCRRNPMDNALGIYFQLFRSAHNYAYSVENIAHQYLQHERLMAHWRKVLPLPIHEVAYEELVSNPDTEIRRLVAFCGLDWDERCLRFHETERDVRTASIAQVRKPLYSSAVDRWRDYEAHLGPLKAAFGQV